MPKEAEKAGVADLAKFMKLEQQTVRGKLRKAKVKKTGGVYAWPKSQLAKIAAQLNAA